MRCPKIIVAFAVLVLGYAFPALAVAEGLSEYLEKAQNDTALKILGFITGPIPGLLDSAPESPLKEMFRVFNVAVFAVAILFILYGVLTGLLMTAWDGEFLGKEISSVWYPIRTVYGVIGLIPMFSGWTFPQLLMLYGFVVGLGIGNLTWQAGVPAVLGHMDEALLIRPEADSRVEIIHALLKAQVCTYEWNAGQYVLEAETGHVPILFRGRMLSGSEKFWQNYKVKDLTDHLGNLNLVYGTDNVPGGIGLDACGGVAIPWIGVAGVAPTEGSGFGIRTSGVLGGLTPSARPPFDVTNVIEAHSAALTQLANDLSPWAEGMVNGTSAGPGADVIEVYRLKYNSTVSKALAAAALEVNSGFGKWMEEHGKSFFYAGAIFPKIMTVNRDIAKAAEIKLEVIPATWNPNDDAGGGLWDSITRAKATIDTWMDKLLAETPKAKTIPTLESLFGDMSSGSMHAALFFLLRGETDLMFGMTNFGYTLLTGSGLVYAAATGKLAILESIWGGRIAGTGVGQPIATLTSLLIALKGLLFPLIMSGAMFAFYIPFLPAVIWYGGLLAIGILFIESLVAAPIWMVAHLETGGKGLGEKTAHGYIFLLNAIFRPTLMVFGLIGGWLLMRMFGMVLRDIMAVLYGSSSFGFSGIASIFMFIATIVMFAYLAMMTVNRLFGLIHHLPNEVISWAGGHLRGIGGGETEEGQGRIIAGGAIIRNQMDAGIKKAEGKTVKKKKDEE